MATIPKTEIDTSDPLSICSGFALFPAIGTSRYGSVSGSSTSGTIFDIKDQSLLLFRLSANAKYDVIFGLCGPAYAVKMNVEGTTDNGTLTLKVSDDEIAAGITFGLSIGFSCNIILDNLQLTWIWNGWSSHFQSTWANLGKWNLNIEVDLLEFIWGLIELFIEAAKEDSETTIKKTQATISKSLLSSWSMLDERSDTFNAGGGQLFAGPTLNIPVDITPMIPAMATLNLALKVFWSRLSFGPQIGFQIPVRVGMSTVKLDTTSYATTYDKTAGAQVGKTTGADPAKPQKITVELDHTAGFDLTFGVFLNMNLVKVFNVGFSLSWPILSALGIKIATAPFANNLTGTIGSTMAQACSTCGSEPAGLFDVIFEVPEGVVVGV